MSETPPNPDIETDDDREDDEPATGDPILPGSTSEHAQWGDTAYGSDINQ
jgi:hypothetical protein